MRIRGLIHVCRKEKAFQRLRRLFAFRRFEKGRKGLFWGFRWSEESDTLYTSTVGICILTGPVGVKGGDVKVGVGSRVESAEAPVSPRNSPPRLPDFRLGRGIVVGWRVS